MSVRNKLHMRGWLWLMSLYLFCIAAYGVGVLLDDTGRQSNGSRSQPELAPVATAVIVMTSTGTYTVPGTAFADGRDQSTNIPITINEILVWDTVDRNEDVCLLEHGEAVTLKAAQFVESEDRYYFEIDAPFCFGWIPATSLSIEKYPPVGQVMP